MERLADQEEVADMSQHDYEFTIVDAALPPGQIAAGDLAALSDKLQQLAHRLARQAAGAEGPGRTPTTHDRMSRLMVTELRAGSTTLAYRLGDPTSLDLPGAPDDQLVERFDEVLTGIAANQPPSWVSPLVAEAAGQLAAVVQQRFDRAGLRIRTPNRVVSVVPARIDCTVWRTTTVSQTQQVTVAGTLYRVDVHTGSFRVIDDAGNDIRLEDVHDAGSVGPWVGSRVVVAGTGEFRDGKLTAVVSSRLPRLELPEEWLAPQPHQPVIAGGSFGDGIDGVTDDEVEGFLSSL